MAMQWLLKVLRYIISCGEEDAAIQYYTRDDNIVSFPSSPLLQSTTRTAATPPTVVHSFQVSLPTARPSSIAPWSTALANKSINTVQSKPSPSVGQSTSPPPIAQLSPALATTNIPSKASPSSGLSKRPPPPIAHSSSATTHSSLLQSTTPATTPPTVIHSFPVSPPAARLPSIVPSSTTLANKSSNSLPSKPSPSVGQSTRPPPIPQLSPALETTNIPLKASPLPGLSKKSPQPTIAHSSSTTTPPLQSKATTSGARTLKVYIRKSPDSLVTEQKRPTC